MNVIIKNNYREVSELAAQYLLNTIKSKNNSVIGLPTGQTPLGMYGIAVDEFNKGSISFKDATTFNLDEYIGLEKTNKNSYYYFMNEHLFSRTDINQKNINIPDSMASDINQECIRYEKKLKEAGYMDILFLGIGENGHIGFNEPSDYFEPYTHLVKLKESTIAANSRFFEGVEDVPKNAITMGIKTIFSAKKIVLIASGVSKSEVIAKTVNGKITSHIPASILQLHNNTTIIIDKDAAKNCAFNISPLINS
mgnify:CR=1 FL=1|jgi:glucosamine-6-phosphate deaminase